MGCDQVLTNGPHVCRANVVRDNVVRVYDVRDFVVPPPPRTRTMDRTTQNYGDNGHVSVRKVISKS